MMKPLASFWRTSLHVGALTRVRPWHRAHQELENTFSKPPLLRGRAGVRGARGARPMLVAWLLALLTSFTAHAGITHEVPTDNTVDITLKCWLQHCPPIGMVEFQVQVDNLSSSAGVWTVSSTDSNYGLGSVKSTAVIPAQGKSVSQARLLVPLAEEGMNGPTYYKNMMVQFTGPGVLMGGTYRLPPPAWSSTPSRSAKERLPFLAVSTTVLQEFPSLPTDLESTSYICAHTTGEAANAPEDWCGYSGLSTWLLSTLEWSRQSAEQRAATLDWVSLGGQLMLQVATENSLPATIAGKPVETKSRLTHGLGEIVLLRNKTAVIKEVNEHLMRYRNSTTEELLETTDRQKWPLAEQVGQVPLNDLLIFLFVLSFAVVVGPLNLFVFASGKNRPRLFWTTPLISLIGASLLAVLMIVQDGFGGTGARTTLAILLPQEKKMALVQEQVARTGILWNSTFAKPQETWMLPMNIPSATSFGGPSGRTVYRVRRNLQLTYHESATEAWGSWFSSRSVQAHLLTSAQLHRGGIEFTPGEPPSIVSSMSTPMTIVFVKDDKNQFWKAEQVRTGVRTPLIKTEEKAYTLWLKKQVHDHASLLLKERVGTCQRSNAWIMAEAAEPARLALPTLSSVQWKHDRAFIAGPYTVSEGLKAKGEEPNPQPSN